MGYVASDENPVALDAAEITVRSGVTREIQNEWALLSRERYAKALSSQHPVPHLDLHP
jgi:acetyl-CoA acetyltransferase